MRGEASLKTEFGVADLILQSENDNSVVRDLQYLQASMLWLDIGAFCGYKRKMEIAESSLQFLVTVCHFYRLSMWPTLTLQALRRAGRFDHVRYPAIAPNIEDNDEQLQVKWKQWAQQESYKRWVTLET